MLNTDRQTTDKRDVTKNTQEAKTFNNPLSTEAVYISPLYSCLQVGHGHWCLIWLLILSFSISFTVSISFWNDAF